MKNNLKISENPEVVLRNAVRCGSDLSFGRYGGMLQEYYVDQFRAVAQKRQERLSQVTTLPQAKTYIAEVRRKLRQSFGELPERTELHAQITGQLTTDQLLIDQVKFESRPGVTVTGLFYRKKDTTGQIPGILALCGHSAEGKGSVSYQSLAQSLAQRGYGVFIVDPIGQGDRRIKDGSGEYFGASTAHNMVGKALNLLGENLSKWMLYDDIRALDYLLSRPEIDHQHLGVTGTSGGGTQTTFIHAFDERLTMAAPSCCITTLLCNMENELPADSEQNPPQFLALGLDTCDLLIAGAPRPLIMLAQDNDFFDRRGTRQAYEEVKKIYTLLGKPDNVQLFVGHGNHGYSPAHREAAGKFFNKFTGLTTNFAEPEHFPTFPLDQIAVIPDKRPIGDDIYEVLLRQLKSFPRPSHVASTTWQNSLTAILNLPAPIVPHYRMLSSEVHQVNQQELDKETFFNRFGLETERGIMVTLKQFAPLKQLAYHPEFKAQATLFIPNLTTSNEVHQLNLTLNPDHDFLACEVRGIGESRPAEPALWHQLFFKGGADNFYAASGLMLHQSFLGRKVYDVLCTVKFLQAHGVKELTLSGNGQGAVVAALAAVLIPQLTAVKLYNSPRSWRSFIEQHHTTWPFSIIPYGVLRYFDLPELYQTIGAQVENFATAPQEYLKYMDL